MSRHERSKLLRNPPARRQPILGDRPLETSVHTGGPTIPGSTMAPSPPADRAIRLGLNGVHITSCTGLIVLREFDHRIGLTQSTVQRIHDRRMAV